MSQTNIVCPNIVSNIILNEPSLRKSIGVALTNFIVSLTDSAILDIWSLNLNDMNLEAKLVTCRYILSTWQFDRDKLLQKIQDKDSKIKELESQIEDFKIDREKAYAEYIELEISGSKLSFENLLKQYFEMEKTSFEKSTDSIMNTIADFDHDTDYHCEPLEDIRALVDKWQKYVQDHFENIPSSRLAILFMSCLPQSSRIKLPRPIIWNWQDFKLVLFESLSSFRSNMEFTDNLVYQLKQVRYGRLSLPNTVNYIKARVELLPDVNCQGLAYLLQRSNLPCFHEYDSEIEYLLKQPQTTALELLEAIKNWSDRQPSTYERTRWRHSRGLKRIVLGTSYV